MPAFAFGYLLVTKHGKVVARSAGLEDGDSIVLMVIVQIIVRGKRSPMSKTVGAMGPAASKLEVSACRCSCTQRVSHSLWRPLVTQRCRGIRVCWQR